MTGALLIAVILVCAPIKAFPLDEKANAEFMQIIKLRDQFRLALANVKATDEIQKTIDLYTARIAGSIKRPIQIAIQEQPKLKEEVFEIRAVRLMSISYDAGIADFVGTIELSILAKTDFSQESDYSIGDFGITFKRDNVDYTMHHIYLFDKDHNIAFMTDFLGLKPSAIYQSLMGRLLLYEVPLLSLLSSETITAY